MLTSPIFPPDLGGPSTYVPNFARWLSEQGHEVTVVAFCSDPEPKGWPFRMVSIPRRFLPLRYLVSFARTWKELKDCDVLYVNEHLALVVALAGKLRGVPMAIRVCVDGPWEITRRYGLHNDSITDFVAESRGPIVALARWLQTLWWSWMRAIVAPSRFLQGIIEDYGVDPGKVVQIHNTYHGPREYEPSQREARELLGLSSERTVILSIARLEIWKGIDGLLRALVELPEDHHLYIVGDGEEHERWTRLAVELGVDERAHFMGNVPYNDIPAWIRACDAFVLNSRYEGLSHALIEVLWIGAPVAVSGVCGNPELVEDGVHGLTFDFNDVAAIVAALRHLLDETENSRRMLEAGRARARELDPELIFARTESLLERVAAGADVREEQARRASATRPPHVTHGNFQS